jgi:hypothetical protein
MERNFIMINCPTPFDSIGWLQEAARAANLSPQVILKDDLLVAVAKSQASSSAPTSSLPASLSSPLFTLQPTTQQELVGLQGMRSAIIK